MTTFIGVIDSVKQITLGSALSADAPVGTTVLNVVDTGDFDDVIGGSVSFDGVTIYGYTAVDETNLTVTLSTSLTTAAFQDDLLMIWDTVNNLAAYEVQAEVATADNVDMGSTISARVNLALVPLLPIGDRDSGTGETAECTEIGGQWQLTDLPGVAPQLRGELMKPGSLQQSSFGFTVGSTKVTIGSVDPSTIAPPNDGDLWYDANNDYQMKQWSASAIPPQWVPYQLGNGALASGAAARTFLQSADPSLTATMRDTDLWIYVDANGGMQMYRWDGATSAWVALIFNTNAIAAAKIAAGQILAGSITSVTIQGALSGSMVGKDGGQPSDISQTNIHIDDTTATGGAILIYETVTTVDVSDTAAGDKTWVCPAGVTSVKVECIGGGASGQGSFYSSYRVSGVFTHYVSYSGLGGGGGEYAREDSVAVVPGNTYSYTVPTGGSGAGTAGSGQNPGNDAVFRAGSTTSSADVVRAYGGNFAYSTGGSADSIHFNSGAGGNNRYVDSTSGYSDVGGPGGGSSGGSSSGGHNGANATGTGGVAGGTAVTDGGAGGAGGAANTAGSAGAIPGGGGGGAGAGSGGIQRNAGSGANGKVKISHTAWTLVASISAVAGTDPKTGVAYSAGFKIYRPDAFEAGGITGEIRMYGGATNPLGWLLCDGSAVSRTTYAALFSAIGTAYGVGDGSTTFNVPNFAGRFPTGNTVGSTGGTATHTHPLSGNGWAKIYMVNPGAIGVAGTRIAGVTSWNEAFRVTGTTQTALTGVTTATPLDGNTDSAGTLPPFTGVKFLIKT